MGRMWKQYGKDVETICEGCGNNMNWKQYDQNFHEPHFPGVVTKTKCSEN